MSRFDSNSSLIHSPAFGPSSDSGINPLPSESPKVDTPNPLNARSLLFDPGVAASVRAGISASFIGMQLVGDKVGVNVINDINAVFFVEREAAVIGNLLRAIEMSPGAPQQSLSALGIALTHHDQEVVKAALDIVLTNEDLVKPLAIPLFLAAVSLQAEGRVFRIHELLQEQTGEWYHALSQFSQHFDRARPEEQLHLLGQLSANIETGLSVDADCVCMLYAAYVAQDLDTREQAVEEALGCFHRIKFSPNNLTGSLAPLLRVNADDPFDTIRSKVIDHLLETHQLWGLPERAILELAMSFESPTLRTRYVIAGSLLLGRPLIGFWQSIDDSIAHGKLETMTFLTAALSGNYDADFLNGIQNVLYRVALNRKCDEKLRVLAICAMGNFTSGEARVMGVLSRIIEQDASPQIKMLARAQISRLNGEWP